MRKGFSTIEIVMAFAVMMTVLVGVILADFSAKYWVITSQTSNEALYKVKGKIEDMRAAAKQDFFQVTSMAAAVDNDASCQGGSLCYTLKNNVTDISTCSKYAEANVGWQVPGYPSSSTSLFTYLTNPTEAIALGGDCALDYPAGDWTDPSVLYQDNLAVGIPSDIDVLSGTSYITGDQSPYLQVATAHGLAPFTNQFAGSAPFNAIDMARDVATGRTYAYVAAATSTQMQVIDMTDMYNPVLVASASLAGVSQADGWRIMYYDRKAYVATRVASGPEFHVFDVVNPAVPVEFGSGTELGASVNAIQVRDQHSSGAPCQAHGGVCRFAYLATSDDRKEVTILDVTDPSNVVTATTVDLPDDAGCSAGEPDAKSLALFGNTLYVGREYNASQCPSLPELYTIDVTDPYAGAAILGQTKISASVNALRVSGPYAFMQIEDGGQQALMVRSTDPAAATPLIGSYALPGLIENGIEFDGSALYTVGTHDPGLQVIYNP